MSIPPDTAAPAAVSAAVADAHRRDWARVLAATVRVTRDLDLAEECVQEAYLTALTAWQGGVPTSPAAWLTTSARNRALDRVRRAAVLQRKLPLLIEPEPVQQPEAGGAFPDDRLRLVFTCCHPALAVEAQIALTLRLVCGLTTPEVAKALLTAETTMAARITRAKKKIAAARIPYRVPTAEQLPERVDAVLHVVHLLYTAGHTAADGPALTRPDLAGRALDLARMLRLLLPQDREVAGLLALILLTDARRATRVDDAGRLQLLDAQDRSRWDRDAIAEGDALVRLALTARPPGRYALQAAIAAVHAGSARFEDTDWAEIVALYDLLLQRWPSPVVALNRAVAVGLAHGPLAGLEALDALAAEPQLARYPYLAASRADVLARLGRAEEARLAYDEALVFTANEAERDFLLDRRTRLGV
ncbi:RNA polymerase sigma factor [uncultured Amnibacterium sp.]|uniref:RNA polymerase sigma factor n=1 Tax=uncultured Amnibacterium sp. TaxID=1631851 RepID=UPI0035CA8C87